MCCCAVIICISDGQLRLSTFVAWICEARVMDIRDMWCRGLVRVVVDHTFGSAFCLWSAGQIQISLVDAWQQEHV